MTVTQKSLKVFRFIFIAKLQNLSLEILENLYRANDVFVAKNDLKNWEKRLELYQKPQKSGTDFYKASAYNSRLTLFLSCLMVPLGIQREARTSLKLLMYILELAYEQKCILFNRYEQISLPGTECLDMLGAWVNSDRKRWGA